MSSTRETWHEQPHEHKNHREWRPILAVSAHQRAVRNQECPTIKRTDRYRHNAVKCLRLRQCSDSRKQSTEAPVSNKQIPIQRWELASLRNHLSSICLWVPAMGRTPKDKEPWAQYSTTVVQANMEKKTRKKRCNRHRRRRTCRVPQRDVTERRTWKHGASQTFVLTETAAQVRCCVSCRMNE